MSASASKDVESCLSQLVHDMWANWALVYITRTPALDPDVRQYLTTRLIEYLNVAKYVEQIVETLEGCGLEVSKYPEARSEMTSLMIEQIRQWLDHQFANASSTSYERWITLAHTPYDLLAEEEKEKDREWAVLYIGFVQ